MKFVAVLDTMWGTSGRAPLYFYINPRNHSGARLYRLTGVRARDLLVVNACPQQTGHATKHGTPSAQWLSRALAALPEPFQAACLLVCGQVAQRTYDAARVQWRGPVVRMLHPAARTWTRAELDRIARQLARLP